MRVVSIGELVTDYYYKNDKLIGINGGMTSHNIIANLAKMGVKTSVFACCGNDCQGKIAIKSLEKIKVDVTDVKIIENVKTRCFHVSYFDNDGKLSFTSKKRCPFCNDKEWYEESLLENYNNIEKNENNSCDSKNKYNNCNEKTVNNSYLLQKEKNRASTRIKKIERDLELLEQKSKDLNLQLTNEEIYSDYERLTMIQNEIEEINNQINQYMDEWERLQTFLEK